MRPPFSAEQFLEVFATYNAAIWPAQIVAYALGIFAVLLVLAKRRLSGRFIACILALFWLWSGIAYHVLFFSSINKPSYVFGLLFIAQGGLFLYFGVIRKALMFRLAPDARGIAGAILIVYSMLVYPLLGYALGHSYPSSPVFGVAPCPTVIFTFGMLLWLDRKMPFSLLLIPVVWSVIGFGAAVFLGIAEDIALIIAGILGIVMARMRGGSHSSTEQHDLS